MTGLRSDRVLREQNELYLFLCCTGNILWVFLFVCFCWVFFAFSRAAPMAYGSSQARGLIRAVAAGLCQSHSNAGSEPLLQPVPQLRATPDP